MNLRATLKLLTASALLGATALASAQTFTVTSIPASGSSTYSALALSAQGRVLYTDNSGNYYLTGASGGGSTSQIGYAPTSNDQFGAGLSVFSINGWGSTPWKTDPYNDPAPATGSILTTDAPLLGGAGNPILNANGQSTLVGIGAANIPSIYAINDNGQIAAQVQMAGSNDEPYAGTYGAVANLSNGTMTVLGGNSQLGGLNDSGVAVFSTGQVQTSTNSGPVVYYYGTPTSTYTTSTTYGGAIELYNQPGQTGVSVAGLGYGGWAGGINSTAEVTGGLYTGVLQTQTQDNLNGNSNLTFGSGDTRAFRTGTNGSATQVFGTANGVSSLGTVINNSGQIGGYITLASGQTEAFLSTAHGGLMVGLGAGGTSDSTTVAFLNNNGQAIIDDTTTNTWYLYSAGYVVPITSLGANANDPVMGFNDAGQILLQDPQLLSPTSSDFGSATMMASYTGSTSLTSTGTYQQVAAVQSNTTPTSTFFTSPTTSTDSITLQSAGVPEPGVLALLGLAAFAVLKLRPRKRTLAMAA